MTPTLRTLAGKAYWKATDYVAHTPYYRFAYRATNWRRPAFACPICRYNGPFRDQRTPDTTMHHSQCLRCGSMERHRLQYLVMQRLGSFMDFSQMSMVHVAPEPCLQGPFARWFGSYATADLERTDVTHRVDLRHLPFDNCSVDCVFASHVLEHIREDEDVLREVARVLTPSGIAVLPVPVVAETTREYPGAYEFGHVRAPGPDYFDRYRRHFSDMALYSSLDFPAEHQVFVYEDRSAWPSPQRPLAPSMAGHRHVDFVPVCYASRQPDHQRCARADGGR